MAGSVNKVILVGNLGADPDIRSFQNGGRVANLRIATSENWKDRTTGERRERTEWHAVVLTGDGLVRVAEQYLRKGAKVYVEGQLRTRKWQDKNGQDRYTTEIYVGGFGGTLTMLDGRSDSMGGGTGGSRGSGYAPAQNNAPFNPAAGGSGSADSGFDEDFDDDVPF